VQVVEDQHQWARFGESANEEPERTVGRVASILGARVLATPTVSIESRKDPTKLAKVTTAQFNTARNVEGSQVVVEGVDDYTEREVHLELCSPAA
jgi:hypothetical protein